MLTVVCGSCGKKYRVPEALSGRRCRCKECSAVISIVGDPIPAKGEGVADTPVRPPSPPASENAVDHPVPHRSRKVPAALSAATVVVAAVAYLAWPRSVRIEGTITVSFPDGRAEDIEPGLSLQADGARYELRVTPKTETFYMPVAGSWSIGRVDEYGGYIYIPSKLDTPECRRYMDVLRVTPKEKITPAINFGFIFRPREHDRFRVVGTISGNAIRASRIECLDAPESVRSQLDQIVEKRRSGGSS
jgi:hypothetical protein